MRLAVLLTMVLLLSGVATAQTTLADVDDIYGEGDPVIYSQGPDFACNTSCRVASVISDRFNLSELLATYPQTPDPVDADSDVIVVGAPDYTNDDLGLNDSWEQDGAEVRLHDLSDHHVVTVRASTHRELYEGAVYLQGLLAGEEQDGASDRSTVVQEVEYEPGDLAEVQDLFVSPAIVHASTETARSRAQELAAAVDGDAMYARDVDNRTVKQRNLIILDRSAIGDGPGAHELLSRLTEEPDVWGSERWSQFDGMRFNVKEHFFYPQRHVLIAAGDVSSRTAHAVTFLKAVWEGRHADRFTGESLTLDHLPHQLLLEPPEDTVTVGEQATMGVEVKEGGEPPADLSFMVRRDGGDASTEADLTYEGDWLSATFDAAGTFTVGASGQDGFVVYESDNVTVEVERKPVEHALRADVEAPDPLFTGENATIMPQVEGEAVEATLEGEGVSRSGESLTVSFDEPGEYTLQLSKENRSTETAVHTYEGVSVTVMVEDPSLLQQAVRWLTSLL